MTTKVVLVKQTAVSSAIESTENYERVVFSCDTLAADTFTVQIATPGGTNVAAFDVNGVAATLATAKPSITVFGGPDYLITKVGTADNAGCYLTPVGRSNG